MNKTPESDFVLTDFLEIKRLQAIQDGFARLTGIATSFRDAEGNALTEPAETPSFCELLQSSASGAEACRLSHAHAAQLAQCEETPCRYQCHAGLWQFVAPILLEGRRLGVILVGARPDDPLASDDLDALADRHGLDIHRLKETVSQLKPWSNPFMSDAANFIQQLAGTIAQLCHNAYQLRCRIDDLAVVHGVASKLAGSVEVQEILDTATGQLAKTMGLRASAIRLLDRESGVLRIASICNLSPEYLDKKPISVCESPIDQEALSGKTVYIRDLSSDPRTFYKDKARAEGLVSALVTALISRGRPIGVLRAYMDRVHSFSHFDGALMEAIASQIAAAIVNARLRREAAEAQRLEHQVRLAADVQRRMIPEAAPDHPHYAFGCIYEPNTTLAGDFYDFLEFPNGQIGVVIADVVGKGVPASLMMASTRSALRAHAKRVSDLGELISEVNVRLYQDTLISEFVTAFYCVLGSDGRTLRYCNAGHEPLLLLRDGEIQELDVGGLVLGVDPAADYEWAEAELRTGDLLVLVTDGVLEALDYDEKAYGRERLHASVLRHGNPAVGLSPELIANQLLWDVRRFVGLAKMSDDITLVVVRVK